MKKQLSKQSRRPHKTDCWGLIVLLLVFLWLLLAGCQGLSAQTVKITPIGANYAYKTVTFQVSWSGGTFTPVDRVWVWIDFCPVAGISPTGSFSPASITSVTTNGGSVDASSLNGRGFFVTSSPTEVTATLSNANIAFNWCAYGSGAPPRATVNVDGGYTLHGAKPFTINGIPAYDSNTFGAGTCITTITDLTERPDGWAEMPVLTGANSPSTCSGNTVSLSVTASSGVTTGSMTYTWTIGSDNYTTTTNSFATEALTSSTPYSVKVTNANNCESEPANGTAKVLSAGNHGQASAPCGCVSGATACQDGVCKNITSYYVAGDCSATCRVRNRTLYDQCGISSPSTYTDTACIDKCPSCGNRIMCEGIRPTATHCRDTAQQCCESYGCYKGFTYASAYLDGFGYTCLVRCQ